MGTFRISRIGPTTSSTFGGREKRNVPISGQSTSVRPTQIERVRELGARERLRLLIRTGCMAEREEAREPPALGFVGVHREMLEVAAAGMRDVIRAACDRTPGPAVVEIEHERRVDRDRRMQTRRGLPRAEAHAADVLFGTPRR